MNTLKMLLVFAVLGGVGYGVYNRLNSRPDTLPPGAPETWGDAPTVQMPGQPSATGGDGSPAMNGTPSPGSPFPANPGGLENLSAFERSRLETEGAAARNPMPDAPLAPQVGAGAPPFLDNATSAPPYGGAGGAAPPYPTTGGAAPPGAEPGGGAQPPVPPGPPTDARFGGGPGPYAGPERGGDPRQGPPTDYAQGLPDNLRSAAANLQGAAEGLKGASVADLRGAAAQLKGAAAADVRGAELASSSMFNTMFEAARRDLDAGRIADVHRSLSTFYDDPRLTQFEQQRLTELLDQLAGTTVYSTQSLLEPPHDVQPGERLEDIGQHYNVPWQLLAKINGIDDPQTLRPGERLKVVKGPFSATVSLEKRQLTLMLGGMYAGRFPIGLGREHPAVEGTYVVTDKLRDPTYYGADRAIEPKDPSNPLGDRWIGLGKQLAIHGTNDPKNIGRTDLPGCISLSPRDADDVFDILSLGSRVVIRR